MQLGAWRFSVNAPDMIRTDLHLHTCLSPCADDEMDPVDVVRMAKLIGIDLVAITDHNSSKNCPVAEIAAKECGIGFIPGAEITTAEEIHCVCLFPTVALALSFNESLDHLRRRVKNRPEIFGHQRIIHPDGTMEEELYLLYSAANVTILELPGVVRSFGGLFWPAHVDRGSNSLLTVLGSWPKELQADAAEVKYSGSGGIPVNIKRVNGSDAHRFYDMRENGFPLPLETATFSGLAKYLRGRRSHYV